MSERRKLKKYLTEFYKNPTECSYYKLVKFLRKIDYQNYDKDSLLADSENVIIFNSKLEDFPKKGNGNSFCNYKNMKIKFNDVYQAQSTEMATENRKGRIVEDNVKYISIKENEFIYTLGSQMSCSVYKDGDKCGTTQWIEENGVFIRYCCN